MESLISLPIFDVFSYLIVGMALIATCVLIFGNTQFFQPPLGLSATTSLLIAAYIIGHIVTFASGVTEELLNHFWLMPPTTYLIQPTERKASSSPSHAEGIPQNRPSTTASKSMQSKPQAQCSDKQNYSFLHTLGSSLISNYTVPLSCLAQRKIEKKFKDASKEEPQCSDKNCMTLYWEAYDTAKQNKEAFDRITTFYELELFSRNISFACVIAIALVLFNIAKKPKAKANGEDTQRECCHRLRNLCKPGIAFPRLPGWVQTPGWQLVAFLLIGLVMFSRYLYFIRAHTIEVLTSYAYLHG